MLISKTIFRTIKWRPHASPLPPTKPTLPEESASFNLTNNSKNPNSFKDSHLWLTFHSPTSNLQPPKKSQFNPKPPPYTHSPQHPYPPQTSTTHHIAIPQLTYATQPQFHPSPVHPLTPRPQTPRLFSTTLPSTTPHPTLQPDNVLVRMLWMRDLFSIFGRVLWWMWASSLLAVYCELMGGVLGGWVWALEGGGGGKGVWEGEWNGMWRGFFYFWVGYWGMGIERASGGNFPWEKLDTVCIICTWDMDRIWLRDINEWVDNWWTSSFPTHSQTFRFAKGLRWFTCCEDYYQWNLVDAVYLNNPWGANPVKSLMHSI